MTRYSRGFTLIEMMAVVAIIAILAAMAVPSYITSITRKQVEAALPLADLAKKPIAAVWQLTELLPADNAALGLPVADKIVNNYVKAVGIKDGVINITFGNRASSALAGKILSLRPAVVEGSPIVPVEWICGKSDGPDKMTIKGVDQTNVPDAYLPINCIKKVH